MLEAFYQVGASNVLLNVFVPVIADWAQDQNHAHVVINEGARIAPLVSITSGEVNKVHRNPEQLKSFTRMKEILVKSTATAHSMVDASNMGIGSALHLNHGGQLVPIFFSKKCTASRMALFYHQARTTRLPFVGKSLSNHSWRLSPDHANWPQTSYLSYTATFKSMYR